MQCVKHNKCPSEGSGEVVVYDLPFQYNTYDIMQADNVAYGVIK